MVRILWLRVSLLLLLLSYCNFSFGQEAGAKTGYRFPMDIDPSVSGSYGELRPGHFHAGVDFGVRGAVGTRLYAAERGYVSRITVSPSGYGNVIYINHPDGLATIYAHMLRFAPRITDYVREEQYRKESFAVNLYPDSTLFRVERGDFIGEVGNSGSSIAPHLHFEIRDMEREVPLNPLSLLNVEIQDNMPPIFDEVAFFSISAQKSFPVRNRIVGYKSETSSITAVSDTFYVAVAATDRQNRSRGKLAVFHYRYFLDGEQIFSFTPDAIPSRSGRDINSVLEYSEFIKPGGKSMIKSWVEPGCGLSNNIKSINNGLFILRDDETHEVRIELVDEHGNMADRRFLVKRDISQKGGTTANDSTASDGISIGRDVAMLWFVGNRVIEPDFRYYLEPGSLYSSIVMNLRRDGVNGQNGWRLHNNNTPLHSAAKISLKADIPDSLKSKALIATVSDLGRLSSLGGEWEGEWLSTKSLSFGLYTVALDTIAPSITTSLKEGERVGNRIVFNIRDDLSGIADYKVYIDDKWVLAEYDAKSSRLTVSLDGRVIERGKNHLVSVEVTDRRGNINRTKSWFIW